MSSRDHLRRWMPVLVWAACISLFSSGGFTADRTSDVILPMLAALFPNASPDDLRALHGSIRKLAHFSEYLLLSILLYRALRTRRRWDARAAVMAIVIAALYSIGDEFHQLFVPGRTAAATDCLIDVSGAAAGQGLVAAFRRRAAA